MIDLNVEIVDDIVSSLLCINKIGELDKEACISINALNYPNLKSSRFYGEKPLTQSVLSEYISNNTEIIDKGDVTDGEIVLSSLESHCDSVDVSGIYEEYLDLVDYEERMASFEDYLGYLGGIGMKYLCLKIPLANRLTLHTLNFGNYIPFLVQSKYKLDECLFIYHTMDENSRYGFVQLNIFYLERNDCSFLECMDVNGMYEAFTYFIDEAIKKDDGGKIC